MATIEGLFNKNYKGMNDTLIKMQEINNKTIPNELCHIIVSLYSASIIELATIQAREEICQRLDRIEKAVTVE